MTTSLTPATRFLAIAMASIFIWFGGLKFNPMIAEAIAGMVSNSPLLSWVYGPFSQVTFAALLGTVEILIGLLLLAGLFKPTLGRIGAIGAIITFAVTLTFLLTTPGVVPEEQSFPTLAGMPGQFLLKDFVLLAVAITLFETYSRTAPTVSTEAG